MLIQNQKIEKYNNLLFENSRKVKKLYVRDEFPRAVMDVEFSALTKDNYFSLVDCCGEKNTQEILGKINDFHKSWVVFNSYLKSQSHIKNIEGIKESDKNLILELSDCLSPQKIDVNTMDFFDSLLKNENFKNNSDVVSTAFLYGYGQLNMPYNLIPKKDANLKLSLFSNLISFDDY